MESWIQFAGIALLFMWCIKRVDQVRIELMQLRNNDLEHIYKDIHEIYQLIFGDKK